MMSSYLLFNLFFLFIVSCLVVIIIHYKLTTSSLSSPLTQNQSALEEYFNFYIKKIEKNQILALVGLNFLAILSIFLLNQFTQINLTKYILSFSLGTFSLIWISPFIKMVIKNSFNMIINDTETINSEINYSHSLINCVSILAILIEIFAITFIFQFSNIFSHSQEMIYSLKEYVFILYFFILGVTISIFIKQFILSVFKTAAKLSQNHSLKVELANNDIRHASCMLNYSSYYMQYISKWLSSTLNLNLFIIIIIDASIISFLNQIYPSLNEALLFPKVLIVILVLSSIFNRLFNLKKNSVESYNLVSIAIYGLTSIICSMVIFKVSPYSIITIKHLFIGISFGFVLFWICKIYSDQLKTNFFSENNFASNLFFLFKHSFKFSVTVLIVIITIISLLLATINGSYMLKAHHLLIFFSGLLIFLPLQFHSTITDLFTSKLKAQNELLNEKNENLAISTFTTLSYTHHNIFSNIITSIKNIGIIPFSILIYIDSILFWKQHVTKSLIYQNEIQLHLNQKLAELNLFNINNQTLIGIVIAVLILFIFTKIILKIIYHNTDLMAEDANFQLNENPDIISGKALPDYFSVFNGLKNLNIFYVISALSSITVLFIIFASIVNSKIILSTTISMLIIISILTLFSTIYTKFTQVTLTKLEDTNEKNDFKHKLTAQYHIVKSLNGLFISFGIIFLLLTIATSFIGVIK